MQYYSIFKSLFFALLCFILVLPVKIVAQNILDQPINFTIQNTPLGVILDSLSQQCTVQFTYDKNRIPIDKEYNITDQNSSLAVVLKQLFADTNISFKTYQNFITLIREEIPYHTISGYIRDTTNNEILLGANIFETKYFLGCSSNEYGFYSLSLPEGKYILKSTYVGYQERQDSITLYQDRVHNILLKEGNQLEEVLVLARSILADSAAISLSTSLGYGERMDIEKAESLPTFMGERDILKYLQLLPGVVSGGLAGNNLYIRGGSLDQNLILLDDVPLYNVNHLFGLVSVFNGDIVQNANTYVDGFPARYGGRLSSIIDIRTKDGNKHQRHGGLSIGLFNATAYLEGPIQKDKSSFVASLRRTWLDIPLRQLNADPTIDFYDFNAKANFILSNKDRIYVSFYKGQDSFDESLKTLPEERKFFGDIDWGNTAFSFRWNHIISNKLFLNTTLYHTTFNFNIHYFKELDTQEINIIDLFYQSHISQQAIKTDFSYFPNSRHQIRFGTRIQFMQNDPGHIDKQLIINNIDNTRPNSNKLNKAQQWTIYAADEWQVHPNIKIQSGLRLAAYRVNNQTQIFPQLRFHAKYAITNTSSAALMYSEMMQPTHLLDNTSIESNAIKWVIATQDAPPATAQQIAFSMETLIGSSWQLKGTAYSKKMNQLRRFKIGADLLNSIPNWEASTVVGTGKAYGMELLFAKIKGTTQGWLAYTYAKSQREFKQFEQEGYFPYQYDRRHTLNLSLSHKLRSKKQVERLLSVVWTYASGNWLTVPTLTFNSISNNPLPSIENINNYQLAPIHRLDISFFRKKTNSKGFAHTWNIGIYNVYGQNNPYSAELEFNPNTNKFRLFNNNLSVTPIPYVTYGFQF